MRVPGFVPLTVAEHGDCWTLPVPDPRTTATASIAR